MENVAYIILLHLTAYQLVGIFYSPASCFHCRVSVCLSVCLSG